jgi:hypothetical protein
MAMAPPTASPMPPDGGAVMGSGGAMDGTEHVVLTVCREADGTYMVYPGDEPDDAGGGGSSDMSEDDADALGPAGAAPSGGGGMAAAGGGPAAGGGSMMGGKPADSKGAALKIALDIMVADEAGSGPGGDADAQFAAGYGSDKAPTPAGMGSLKYPPS